MDFFCKGMNDEPSDSPSHENTAFLRCPFLKNINKPTSFSFSPLNFPSPVHGLKGPIFEDGPNFDMAFKLFHGKDGVVPLSNRSHSRDDIVVEPEPVPPRFNPLPTKAATISLSAFGPFGSFGFNFNNNNGKKQNKKPDSTNKKEPTSQKGHTSKHEALGNEWLETGSCPIAKSYRAVSRVLPLLASTLQPPPGMKLKCPPAIVAARAALARTTFVKNLRPQPLPAKVFVIALLGMALNVPLGIWREHTEKFSIAWFTAVHAAVPFIAMLRKSVLMPKTAMALTIGASVIGQLIGSRAERYRLKAVAEKDNMAAQTAFSAPCAGYGSTQVGGIAGNHCASEMNWNQQPMNAGGPISPTNVC
ncbi:hypothetical protein Tsubulata_006617 [Turnera subulata]|uniref:Uncharacterized protein n=1 Tax=Turnera subulata TaxID=218843 RepID=A0A9Q0FDM6_9ROSI|nr:hypothetical protein Tsubulata_006617 [Turnera subulata]